MKRTHLGMTDVFGKKFEGPFKAVTKDGKSGKDFPPVITKGSIKDGTDDTIPEEAYAPDAHVVDSKDQVVCSGMTNVTAKLVAMHLNTVPPTSEEQFLFRPGNSYGYGQRMGGGNVSDSEFSRHFWAIRLQVTYTDRATGEKETKFRYIGETISPYSSAMLMQDIHGALKFSSLASAAHAIRMAKDVILKRSDVLGLRERIRKHQMKVPVDRCPKLIDIDWETMTPVCIRFMYEEVYVADLNNPPTNNDVFYNTVPDKEMEKEIQNAAAEVNDKELPGVDAAVQGSQSE